MTKTLLGLIVVNASFWLNTLPVFLGGALFGKIIDLLIAWAKERREQKSRQTAHAKDRPRFRIDTAKSQGSHPSAPDLVVTILSLGGLPLTIDEGEVFIEAEHYPERVKTHKLDGREISSMHPIEVRFPLPGKLIDPQGIGEPHVKLVCHFSYGEDNQKYYEDWMYNRHNGEFE